MIRVNLLNPLGGGESRMESLVRTGGSSAFIARREVVLGFICLAIACGALFHQMRGPATDAAARAAPPDGSPESAEVSPIIEIDGPETPRSEVFDTIASEEEAGQDSRAVGAEQQAEARTPSMEKQTSAEEPLEKPSPGSTTAAVQAPTGPATTDTPATQAPAAASAAALSQLVVSAQGNALRIFAATGTQPQYKTFRLDRPNRIVVDLPGVRLALPREQHEQAADHPQVNKIRAGLYRANPPQTRVVLDVTSFPEIEILPQFNGLYLVVTERVQ